MVYDSNVKATRWSNENKTKSGEIKEETDALKLRKFLEEKQSIITIGALDSAIGKQKKTEKLKKKKTSTHKTK